MHDQLIIKRLKSVYESIVTIQSYTTPIKKYEDFHGGDGQLIYDAVLMRLQVIGENIKAINKKAPDLIDITTEEISSIIRFHDLISHHYEKLDTELVFDICTIYIPRLKQQIEELLTSYK